MSKKQKKRILRILIAAFSLALLLLLSAVGVLKDGLLARALFLVPYLAVGFDILKKAVWNSLHGDLFDENFLMSIASVGAFALGETTEACAVMLLYQIGELCQELAVGKSRRSIASLMDIRPDVARAERDGALVECPPDTVSVGETIVVRAGEKIPLDGVVADGAGAVDTAALTGESHPQSVRVGDEVLSGTLNLSGTLKIRVTKPYGESTVSKILALLENAGEKKAKTEAFITRFSRRYTPAVVGLSVLLAVVPGALTGKWNVFLYRALTFLVISCPCALVISVPLGFFGGIGGASKRGILIKGGNYMEALARCRTVVFDKTGTLTKGVFRVVGRKSAALSESSLLEYAALAESNSTHPIAASIRDAYGKMPDRTRIARCEEIAGEGVRAVIDGHAVCVGDRRLLEAEGVSCPSLSEIGTVVHLSFDGAYGGALIIFDEIKEDAACAVAKLKEIGIRKTVLLTGDSASVGQSVAHALALDEVHAELLPADKVAHVESMLRAGEALAFVGDGINDAPVLARADVGIAMGAIGSDAAIEASDVVLMDDKPSKIPLAIAIAKRTIGIVRMNIVFALAVKVLVLILGALGFAKMGAAVFADVGVCMLCILNAMRALRTKRLL